MRLYSILFICLLINSCDRSKNKISRLDKISKIDTTCLKAIKEATNDFKKGALFYCHDDGALLYSPLRCEHELDSLINLFGLKYKGTISSDLVHADQTIGCYADYMNKKITEKFGPRFIDSLLYVADSLFVTKNPDKIFADNDCDTEPKFPGDTVDKNPCFNPRLQMKFDKVVKYPRNYSKKKSGNLAFANFNLEIDRLGKSKIIQSYFVFDNYQNKRYEKLFADIFEPLILSTKWTPATIKKQNVRSKISTFIYFE